MVWTVPSGFRATWFSKGVAREIEQAEKRATRERRRMIVRNQELEPTWGLTVIVTSQVIYVRF